MGLLKMACMGFLAISARAQPRQNCSVVVSPFTVSSTEDASTLATSLGCSIGDVDVQWVGEVFVVETIHVTDGTSLSITGAGSSAAIADGRNSTQLFVVDRSSRLHLSDMTLAHGNASFGGAINALEASVSFSGNVSFISNSAGVGGGAIFANRSRIFWDGDGTQFIFNVAGDDGGAIYAQGASNVSWSGDGTQFISNSADGDDGGAIWAAYSSTVSWEGDDTEFRNNSADDDGGAIFAWESTVSWSGDGTQFIANSAAIDGGAIGAYLGSNVSWDGDATVFSNNSAGDDGGAIYTWESTVSWEGDGTQFYSNFVDFVNSSGGAIYASGSTVFWGGDGTDFISNSAGDRGGAVSATYDSTVSWVGNGTEFSSNFAGADGGAIYVTESTLSCASNGTQIRSNFANFSGGAIYATESSTVSWRGDGTQFISNSANASGGAIYVDESLMSWFGDGTDFSSNSAGREDSGGGAIYARQSTFLWYGNDAKFSANSADEGGALYVAESPTMIWHGHGARFLSNSATVGSIFANGGAIYLFDSTVSWNGDDTELSSNSAHEGGAIYAYRSTVYWHGNVTRLDSNSADEGGAIYASYTYVDWDGEGTQFYANSAGIWDHGGAMYVYYSTVYWNGDGTEFSSNFAADGGAIYVTDASVFWNGNGTQFNSNSAEEGGAIKVVSSTVTWGGEGIQFNSNSANISGGAIFVDASDEFYGYELYYANVFWDGDGTEFNSNSAGDDGGAIFVTGMSRVFSEGNTTFSRNVAGENGGAIASVGSEYPAPILYGGTFVENAAGNGGAIYVGFGKGFNISEVTFKSNSAGSGGAVAAYTTGSEDEDLPAATFSRCTFSDNMGETGGAVGTLAAHVQFTSCFFEGNTAGRLTCSSNARTRISYTSPRQPAMMADVGGALRLDGGTVVSGCSFLSNSAVNRGLAVAVEGSTNISTSTFEGNELFCAAGSYRKYTEKERPTARYEEVCLDCPDWDQCSDCSIANGDVTATCQVPLENTQAKENGVTLETLDVTGGYWRATNDSVYILACYNADACIGGQTGAEDYCAPGYTGPYCAVCEPDYSPSLSFTCTRCSRSRSQGLMAATVIAALVIACVVVAIVRYLVSTQLGEERSTGYFRRKVLPAIPLQALKIIVVVWQILIQFADAAQATYPGVYQDFLSAIDIVNFDLGSVLSAGCLWSNMDFHDRVLVNTLGPLVVVGLLGITYRIAIYRSSSAGGDAVVEKIRYRHQTVLLLVTFLIYSSVSSTVFQTFACEKLDDGAEYLRADYSIQCTDAKHKNFEVYAGIMIFVYPVGIPLLYAILLFQRRDVLANGDADKTKAQSIAGLWEPYRPERFYYEVVECGRRIMLTGVVVFIFPNDAAQLAITMLLAFFFFMVFEMLRPYEAESDMWLSRGGHMTVFLSMFYLLLLKVDVSGERSESQAIYGGLLVACHVVMVLAIVVEVVGICYASRGKKHVVEETASSSESLPKSGARAGSDGAP